VSVTEGGKSFVLGIGNTNHGVLRKEGYKNSSVENNNLTVKRFFAPPTSLQDGNIVISPDYHWPILTRPICQGNNQS
jgi:hypothetical protein